MPFLYVLCNGLLSGVSARGILCGIGLLLLVPFALLASTALYDMDHTSQHALARPAGRAQYVCIPRPTPRARDRPHADELARGGLRPCSCVSVILQSLKAALVLAVVALRLHASSDVALW